MIHLFSLITSPIRECLNKKCNPVYLRHYNTKDSYWVALFHSIIYGRRYFSQLLRPRNSPVLYMSSSIAFKIKFWGKKLSVGWDSVINALSWGIIKLQRPSFMFSTFNLIAFPLIDIELISSRLVKFFRSNLMQKCSRYFCVDIVGSCLNLM